MKRESIRSIIEELFDSNPLLLTAHEDKFTSAVRAAAEKKGYHSDEIPTAWNLVRARFDIKAIRSGKKKKKLSKSVSNLINKARQSALEGVAAYNNPMSPFRSGAFIVHMHIAWTSLLLAVFYNRGEIPVYKDERTEKIKYQDGDEKKWELSKCAREYWQGGDYAIQQNVEFFVGLRNKIEHSLMPELDLHIFGECQANLINFETVLTKEFGHENALAETLAMSLQFSHLRHSNNLNAIRKLQSPLKAEIKRYIDGFRSSLSNDTLNAMEYSYKVFLLPNLGNHRSKDALAVEFVNFDSLEPEEVKNYDRVVSLIKLKQVPIANIDLMRPGIVVQKVSDALKPIKFTQYHHTCSWKYFCVRPPKKSITPDNCDTRYCVYDSAHNDYLYTEKWVQFLISKLSNTVQYNKILENGKPGK